MEIIILSEFSFPSHSCNNLAFGFGLVYTVYWDQKNTDRSGNTQFSPEALRISHVTTHALGHLYDFTGDSGARGGDQ